MFQPLIVLANLPLPTPIHSLPSLSTASLEQSLLGEALAAIDTGQVVDAVVEEVEGRRRSLLIPRRPDMSPGWTTSCCNVRQSAEAPSLVGRESGSLFAPQTPTSWLRPSRLGDPLVSLRPVPCPAPPQHLGALAKTECWVGAELTTLLPISHGALYIYIYITTIALQAAGERSAHERCARARLTRINSSSLRRRWNWKIDSRSGVRDQRGSDVLTGVTY